MYLCLICHCHAGKLTCAVVVCKYSSIYVYVEKHSVVYIYVSTCVQHVWKRMILPLLEPVHHCCFGLLFQSMSHFPKCRNTNAWQVLASNQNIQVYLVLLLFIVIYLKSATLSVAINREKHCTNISEVITITYVTQTSNKSRSTTTSNWTTVNNNCSTILTRNMKLRIWTCLCELILKKSQ